MARLMFSAGILAAFASAIIVRSRGFMSGSPPPPRAATVNSLMMRVNILPRLASSAPFLCLMDAHFEWPDMAEILALLREDEPHVGPRIPGLAAVVAEDRLDAKSRALEASGHLRHGERAEDERESACRALPAARLGKGLIEEGELFRAILPD